jgi:hypothetical protein
MSGDVAQHTAFFSDVGLGARSHIILIIVVVIVGFICERNRQFSLFTFRVVW